MAGRQAKRRRIPCCWGCNRYSGSGGGAHRLPHRDLRRIGKRRRLKR
jgi:hypothetical protein